jgi:hypothetical protein
VQVIESRTAEITSVGGSISFQDGSGVFFPAGAVSSPRKITIARLDPTSFFDGKDAPGVVLRCDAAETQFSSEVEVRVPWPGDIQPGDSAGALAGILDENTRVVTIQRSSLKIIDAKPVLVIPTKHFTTFVEWFFAKKPPKALISGIPYYSQGKSFYCWAAVLEMLLQSAHYVAGSQVTEVVGDIGVTEGTDDTGVTASGVFDSEEISRLSQKRTGLLPDKLLWDGYTIDDCLDYIKYEVGVKNRPVAFLSMAWGHAAVIMGYDGNRVYLHDPQLGQLPYTWRPWSDFREMGWSRLQKIATVCIPTEALDQHKPEVTVNLNNTAIEFIKAPTSGEKTKYYSYRWDYTVRGGWSFREIANADDPGLIRQTLPGDVKTICIGGMTASGNGIRIANSSPNRQHVLINIDIQSSGAGNTHFSISPSPEIDIDPDQVSEPFLNKDIEIPVDEFRDNNAGPTSYNLTVSTLVNNKVTDQGSIQFSLETEKPKIDSIILDHGSIGSAVTINGSGFGTVRGQTRLNKILINGLAWAEIISWSEKEIQARVPSGASTGPVVVKRGTVESNGQVFTVIKDSTLTPSPSPSLNPAGSQLPELQRKTTFTLVWRAPTTYQDRGDNNKKKTGQMELRTSTPIIWDGATFKSDAVKNNLNTPTRSVNFSGTISSDGKTLLSVEYSDKDTTDVPGAFKKDELIILKLHDLGPITLAKQPELRGAYIFEDDTTNSQKYFGSYSDIDKSLDRFGKPIPDNDGKVDFSQPGISQVHLIFSN